MARKKAVKHCPWRANRRFFPHITQAMWDWLERFLGGDGITMRVVVMAGGRHARKIAQALLDHKKLLEAGFPVKFDLVAVFCEDPRTLEGSEYWNAFMRFYWSCAGRRPDTRIAGELGGKWINQYVTSFERWRAQMELTSFLFEYGDPCDAEFRTRVDLETRLRRLRGLGSNDRLFHCAITLPWGRWIGAWVRDMCGEVVLRDADNKPVLIDGKRQLRQVGDAKWTNGFVFGLHPLYAAGGAVVAEALSGADPLERILASYLQIHSNGFEVDSIKGRMGVFGVGPAKMDDGRLFCHAGPPGKLADWKFGDRHRPLTLDGLTEDELHDTLREMVESSKELYPRTILVKRHREGYGFADVIANQTWILAQAHARLEA